MFDRGRDGGGQQLSGISPNVTVEKVENVWGSTAGAGSDFFHIYRKHRYTEMDRLKQMDEDWEKKTEMETFEAERERLKKLDESVTAKKRDKRKRKQANKKTNKNNQNKKLQKETERNEEQTRQDEEEEEGPCIRVGHQQTSADSKRVKGPMRPPAADTGT
eukprot:GHVS01064564.1.p2 GENE.GHVS01064564.1~~GHVS01064564.1.p2  ORF type:complete len:161 (+),score=48.25 GHVS01064564.1:162-644(+)